MTSRPRSTSTTVPSGQGGSPARSPSGNPEQAETNDDETLNREILPSGVIRCDLGGAKVVLQLFSLTSTQSIPTGSQIIGYLFLPFVDKWKRINASIGGPDGDFMIELGGAGDEELSASRSIGSRFSSTVLRTC